MMNLTLLSTIGALISCAVLPVSFVFSQNVGAASGTDQRAASQERAVQDREQDTDERHQQATFGSGCFWCTEAVFQQVRGVISVESGYSGGHIENPTYEQVSHGRSGHAEVVRIVFDPEVIEFEKLLEVFWATHDPTTRNRQGADVGPQYRSVIFYHNDEQKELAEHFKAKLDESGAFPRRIVTEISPLINYYRAEEYHQNFFRRNPGYGYCQAVIRPKLEKLRQVFGDSDILRDR